MLKKSTLAALLMALTVFATSCGKDEPAAGGGGGAAASGPDLSTPQGAMKELQAAFASMDTAKLAALYTAEAWNKHQKEFEQMKADGVGVTITFTDADITVEGEKAVAATKMKFKMKDGKEEEESEKFRLVKVDGKWKFEK